MEGLVAREGRGFVVRSLSIFFVLKTVPALASGLGLHSFFCFPILTLIDAVTFTAGDFDAGCRAITLIAPARTADVHRLFADEARKFDGGL